MGRIKYRLILYVSCKSPVCLLYVSCMSPLYLLYSICMSPVCEMYVRCMSPCIRRTLHSQLLDHKLRAIEVISLTTICRFQNHCSQGPRDLTAKLETRFTSSCLDYCVKFTENGEIATTSYLILISNLFNLPTNLVISM